MRLMLLIFSQVIVASFGNAQSNLLLNEKFDDNRNNWAIGESERYQSYIENGEYFLETKGSIRSFYKELYLNPKENFYIECSLRLVDQVEKNYGFGLVWTSSRLQKHYFDISKSGSFIIYSYLNGETQYQVKWKKSEAVKIGESNKLAIRKQKNTTSFYINDVLVHQEADMKYLGNYVGLAVGRNTKIAVDYLVVHHPPTPINLVPNIENGYMKENLGVHINSKANELHPVVSHDGNYLYVTRDDHPDNIGEKKLQDVWVSTLDDNGNWGVLEQLPAPINTDWHNSISSISPDNNTIYVDMDEGDLADDTQGLFFSNRTADGWSEPEEVVIEEYYNNNRYESFHFSANRKIMITSLERDDTNGEKDLYVCFRRFDGSWTAPMNLGDDINSYGEEMTPFLAADNKTLYFSSQSYVGYGSADVFVSRRLDDTWTKWSKPQNLGPEINTDGWDAHFSYSAAGDYAYMVSYDSGGFGGGDAYRIKLAESAKPYPVIWVSGVVYDKFTNDPMQAEIRYEVIGRPNDSGVALSDPKTGYYQIVLPYGESYDIRANAEGHIPISNHVEFDENVSKTEYMKDLFLEPIVTGKVFNLKNVLFERGTSELLESSFQELDKLVVLMIENPTLEIQLGGHTDNRGDRGELIKLSTNRVETVKKYLIRKGIREDRITGKGYGRSQPITKNRSEEERRKNRRVEFKVTSF